MGISAAHFVAGLVGCEHPFDARAGSVALLLPCGDFGGEPIRVVDSTVQALAAQDADLDLDHVEPAGVLGSVVELQAAQDAPGFGGREGHGRRPHGYGRPRRVGIGLEDSPCAYWGDHAD